MNPTTHDWLRLSWTCPWPSKICPSCEWPIRRQTDSAAARSSKGKSQPEVFFCFFFNQVQAPVTLFSGDLWSILVVGLAHSAELRSRLRHVSSAPSVACNMGCSLVITYPGTNHARRCLTSAIWREPVTVSPPLGRRQVIARVHKNTCTLFFFFFFFFFFERWERFIDQCEPSKGIGGYSWLYVYYGRARIRMN